MTDGDAPTQPQSWHRRLHAALMPDYNPASTVYWWAATGFGGGVLLWCMAQVLTLPARSLLQIFAGALLAICAGLFPVRIPGTKLSFGVGEVTIFLLLLLQGAAAATVLAAAEASIVSYRTSKRWTSRLGSPAMAALAMYPVALLFEVGQAELVGDGKISNFDNPGIVSFLAFALSMGLFYFIVSATFMGGVARLRRGKNLLGLSDLLREFRWVGLAYAASAMFAALLFLVYLQAGAGVFAVTVPLLLMLLLILHFFYRQQEAQQAMRAALADIVRREEAMRVREEEMASLHEGELQLSERRFYVAFTSAAIGMVLLDLEGRVIESNEALCTLLGRDADELSGQGFAGLLHADDRGVFVSYLSTARDVHFEDFQLELRLRGAGSRLLRVRANCSFFPGPAIHGGTQAGKPCLMLQVQVLDPASGQSLS